MARWYVFQQQEQPLPWSSTQSLWNPTVITIIINNISWCRNNSRLKTHKKCKMLVNYLNSLNGIFNLKQPAFWREGVDTPIILSPTHNKQTLISLLILGQQNNKLSAGSKAFTWLETSSIQFNRSLQLHTWNRFESLNWWRNQIKKQTMSESKAYLL